MLNTSTTLVVLVRVGQWILLPSVRDESCNPMGLAAFTLTFPFGGSCYYGGRQTSDLGILAASEMGRQLLPSCFGSVSAVDGRAPTSDMTDTDADGRPIQYPGLIGQLVAEMVALGEEYPIGQACTLRPMRLSEGEHFPLVHAYIWVLEAPSSFEEAIEAAIAQWRLHRSEGTAVGKGEMEIVPIFRVLEAAASRSVQYAPLIQAALAATGHGAVQ